LSLIKQTNLKDKLLFQNAILRHFDAPEDEVLALEVKTYREESEENEIFYQEIKQIWETSAETVRLKGLDFESSVDSLRMKIGGRKSANKTIAYWSKVAAAILAFAAIGFWFYQSRQEPVYIVMQNDANHPDSLLLKDGTKIMLAAHSSLRYPEEFDQDLRQVRLLEGQAFFLVAKDKQHPFEVQIGQSAVRVLGTSFNINYSSSEIDLAIQTGRVMFTPNSSSTPSVLIAGEALKYNLIRNEISRENGSNATAWLTNEFHFVDTPLEEVCRQLSEHYKVPIVLSDDAHSTKKFNAKFKDSSLDEVLTVLKRTYPVSIVKTDNLIEIKSL
jgi:transmembrane sensor